MSKAIKKVTKGVKKFVSKVDPALDSVLGISAKEDAVKQADRQFEQQVKETQLNTNAAAEQARAAALAMQSSIERQKLQANAEDLNAPVAGEPEVDLALSSTTESPTARRRRFQSGGGQSGPSIRL